MNKPDCKTIQSELDELMLSEDCSASALSHLTECYECREFRDKQTKLREIVGSLGTVAAPADFDFRLRSRLARENSTTSFLNRSVWSLGQKSVAATLALVILFGAVMLVRYFSNTLPQPTPELATENNKPSTSQPAKETPDQLKPKQTEPIDTIAVTPKTQPPSNVSPKGVRPGSKESRKQFATVDFASTRAPVIRPEEVPTTDTVFPVDTTQQSFKVSLFDGRGNPRTISVPTVSFGSQRVLPVSNQVSPKGIW